MNLIIAIVCLTFFILGIVRIVVLSKVDRARIKKHQEAVEPLKPVRSLTSEEQELFKTLYRRNIKSGSSQENRFSEASEIPVYKVRGLTTIHALTVKGNTTYYFTLGGVFVHPNCYLRLSKKGGFTLSNIYKVQSETIKRTTDRIAEEHPELSEKGREEELEQLVMKEAEPGFPEMEFVLRGDNSGKPAWVISTQGWSLDDWKKS